MSQRLGGCYRSHDEPPETGASGRASTSRSLGGDDIPIASDGRHQLIRMTGFAIPIPDFTGESLSGTPVATTKPLTLPNEDTRYGLRKHNRGKEKAEKIFRQFFPGSLRPIFVELYWQICISPVGLDIRKGNDDNDRGTASRDRRARPEVY